MTETAYVALGSNMGEAVNNIQTAIEALDSVPGIRVEEISGIYETKPWGYDNQNNFRNACARLEVNISPEALLGVCLGIEAGMGRVRTIKNGPRVIDIDLIMYSGQTRNTAELILPHPRMKERDFVLIPLYDVAKDEIKEEIKNNINNLTDRYIL